MKRLYKTMKELADSQLLYDKELPAFGYMLMAIMVIALFSALIWSLHSKKVYIVKSSGVVVSEEKNYIMPSFGGEIKVSHVKEGDYVVEGDVLFEVSSVDLDLQAEQIEGMIEIAQEELTQYQRLEESIKTGENLFDETNSEDKSYFYIYETYISQVEQKNMDMSPYKQYGYSDSQIDNTITNNEAAIAEIYYSTLRSIADSVSELEGKIASYEVQLASIYNGQSEYPIKASASGLVHMDTEYKEGMVVQAGAVLGSIVNENDSYWVSAYVDVNDIPLIHMGDYVDIAIVGLNQTIYGTIAGRVTYVSSEATVNSEEGTSSFLVKVEPESTYLVSDEGRKVNISNGMAVECRIQYDEVTYFNYLLDSLGVLVR